MYVKMQTLKKVKKNEYHVANTRVYDATNYARRFCQVKGRDALRFDIKLYNGDVINETLTEPTTVFIENGDGSTIDTINFSPEIK